MGGHSAWRKRIKNGELAKQSGGAICRHRPHLGRKGKDIEKNKRGNILGGPNKKKKKKIMNLSQRERQQINHIDQNDDNIESTTIEGADLRPFDTQGRSIILLLTIALSIAFLFVYKYTAT